MFKTSTSSDSIFLIYSASFKILAFEIEKDSLFYAYFFFHSATKFYAIVFDDSASLFFGNIQSRNRLRKLLMSDSYILSLSRGILF